MGLEISKYRTQAIVFCVLIIFIGGILGYLKYGIEPFETIGGFLCGLGLILLLVAIFSKKKKRVQN
jgi:hypothetical protein